jgi:Cu-processing system ATP-binding protein
VIEITGLRKRFGRLDVLQGVDAKIASGRITGIVGPNAAGKTTLMKAVLGLTHPDQGRITVGGTRVNGDESYRRKIGYMPQIARFPSSMTGRELLAMLKSLRPQATAVDDRLIGAFGIEHELDKKLNDLSGGTKQKINAVAAFLFEPELLILDEPTAGLDPRSSTILKDRILAERERGRTFVITSHIMAELEQLADDVIFLSDGRVRFSGSLDEVMSITSQKNLERAIAELMEREVAA